MLNVGQSRQDSVSDLTSIHHHTGGRDPRRDSRGASLTAPGCQGHDWGLEGGFMKVLCSLYTLLAALSFLSMFSLVSSAQIPSGWLAPTAVCANEGQACTFDSDCCQRVCKDHLICEAPLFCVPPRYFCDTNDECCDKAGCNVAKHECAEPAS